MWVESDLGLLEMGWRLDPDSLVQDEKQGVNPAWHARSFSEWQPVVAQPSLNHIKRH